MTELRKISDWLYEVPQSGAMRVPGRIFASAELIDVKKQDEAVAQVANVATLPGIVGYSMAMPDFHWGYGFPIGGVAAFDVDEGVVSPGGLGYDLNCGVRLMRTSLVRQEVQPRIKDYVRNLFRAVPAGVGGEGAIPRMSKDEFRAVMSRGAAWAVERGYGHVEDLAVIEDGGCLQGADPDAPSERAVKRGLPQIGTLGSGNHFLEVQVVDEIYRPEIATRLGLHKNQICVAIHSGSRGFGYQICDESIGLMLKAAEKYEITLVDRQLCCAPLKSPEAERYLSAMRCAANFAWVNRQVMRAIAERVTAKTFGKSERDVDMRLIYDVCHNIGKFEDHTVEGKPKKLFVHRKGATRAFPPGHPALPEAIRDLGQPVFVPGDMGRASFLLIGAPKSMELTWGSTCHGAGRAHSRSAMIKMMKGRNLFREMEEERGVVVMAHGHSSVAEEMPEAYKDAALVVDVMERAGISKKVVRLRPIGCVKG